MRSRNGRQLGHVTQVDRPEDGLVANDPQSNYLTDLMDRYQIPVGVIGGLLATSLRDGLAAYECGNFATALEILRPIADNGDAIAQYGVGLTYEADADDAEAAKWYRKAADQGHTDAQYSLGNMSYRFFMQFERMEDFAESIKWCRKAADRGHADAQYSLGLMCEADADYAEAAKWHRKAADQGNAEAQYRIGRMYVEGLGVRRNAVQAYRWLSLAALCHDPVVIADRDSVATSLTPPQIARAQRLTRKLKPK